MDESLVSQILDELISSLEPLEAQNRALIQFVKDKGIASDDVLAPYLERAANASNVRWRAFRLRTLSLISSAMKAPVEEQKKEEPKPKEKNASAQTKAPGQQKEEKAPGQENVTPTPEANAGKDREAAMSTERAEQEKPKDQTQEQGQDSRESKPEGRKDAA